MRRTPFYNFFIVALLVTMTASVSAQQVDSKLPWSVRLTESEMIRYPESWQLDFQPKLKWDYCHGLELGAMLDVYDAYGDKKIRDYAIAYTDTMVHEDGSITAYKLTDYSLDRINSGKILFRIYEQTKNPKYKKALDLLYSQFEGQPRNEDGGFWHKKIYPHQMWLDGIFMASPYLVQYGVLEFIPQHEAGRDSLLDILNNVAVQVKKLQDPKTGGWYQVMDRSGDKGNYVESSCSAMFIYSLFKAVRLGYIDKSYLDVALKGYKGFLDNFIEVDKNGLVTITKACAVAGLGGKVYRSGDYDYYINETIRNNDPKAVGPFIMASLEYERLQK